MGADVEKFDRVFVKKAVDDADIAGNGERPKAFFVSGERVISEEGMREIIDKDSDTRAILAVEFWRGKNALLIVFSKYVSVNEVFDHEADP